MSSIIKVDTIQTAAGGTPTAAGLGLNTTGSVLQVVQGTPLTSSTSLNNSSYASIMSVTITPTASSSSFFIMFSGIVDSIGDSYWDARYAKTVGGTTTTIFDVWASTALNFGSANQHGVGYAMNYLDSPNTTSEIVYKLEARDRGSSNVNFAATGKCTFTVMEIAG